MPLPKVSLESQIAECQRELALRRQVYSHQVASRKMRQAVADLHMAHMEAILRTLEFCRDHAALIREVHERTKKEKADDEGT